ncbi:reverse partial [Lasallia pustulata]|uniref:Reverse partial n=1 Tax=Lasallia pustulata TaxID=136370 RepID=A0A1W5CSX4_9LECA|nr:reverse partial [Lasallia pustulata]
MFLSKMLSTAESHYWPTELEMAGLVWAIKKLRHLVDSTVKPVIIYTNHSAITSIAKQTSLSSSNIDKLNNRLIQASQYLAQFDIDVRYKPDKHHLVPDALSQLPVLGGIMDPKLNILDGLTEVDAMLVEAIEVLFMPERYNDQGAFNVTLVEMGDKLKDRLKQAYMTDERWSKIREEIKGKDSAPTAAFPDFCMHNDLIYLIDHDKRERLVVPKTLEKEVFELSHNSSNHQGFHRAFDRLTTSMYFDRNAAKWFREYIEHCPACQLNQTKRHRPYGELNPIHSTPVPFNTIAMDFVVGLPESTYRGKIVNALLNLTDKYSKRTLIIPGKDTYTAKDWAIALLEALQAADWGIPRQILSDRDPKFLSKLWSGLFAHLGVKLLLSTAWHPQMDGASERTNQTVEIALQYHVTENPDTPWPECIVPLQATLNNSINSTIGKTPTELMYGFKVKEPLSFIGETGLNPQVTNLVQARDLHRKQAQDLQTFALTWAKRRYNRKHKKLDLKEGDLVYLRLHHGYNLPGMGNRKLSNQQTGPFKIIKKVGSLAYKLELPRTMQIHPVISVAHLEPCPDPAKDPYNRPRPSNPLPVIDEPGE